MKTCDHPTCFVQQQPIDTPTLNKQPHFLCCRGECHPAAVRLCLSIPDHDPSSPEPLPGWHLQRHPREAGSPGGRAAARVGGGVANLSASTPIKSVLHGLTGLIAPTQVSSYPALIFCFLSSHQWHLHQQPPKVSHHATPPPSHHCLH